ncbi:uncharacterized protein FFFS_15759 [Fusarium fujikuroi]|nr:uncharacterized protein FFFS_15759 [Fusarium fujikuroi]
MVLGQPQATVDPAYEGSAINQQTLQRMSKAMNQVMRAILPVWKTTPITILHRESGIPPVVQLLEENRWTRLILWRAERARLPSLHTTTSSSEDTKDRRKTSSGRVFDAQTSCLHHARGRSSYSDTSDKKK